MAGFRLTLKKLAKKYGVDIKGARRLSMRMWLVLQRRWATSQIVE